MLNDLDKSGLDWTGRGYINKLLLLLEMGKVRGGVEENLDFLLFYFTFWAHYYVKRLMISRMRAMASYGQLVVVSQGS